MSGGEAAERCCRGVDVVRAAVDQIAGDQNQIRVQAIHFVNLLVYPLRRLEIADVQIAEMHDPSASPSGREALEGEFDPPLNDPSGTHIGAVEADEESGGYKSDGGCPHRRGGGHRPGRPKRSRRGWSRQERGEFDEPHHGPGKLEREAHEEPREKGAEDAPPKEKRQGTFRDEVAEIERQGRVQKKEQGDQDGPRRETEGAEGVGADQDGEDLNGEGLDRRSMKEAAAGGMGHGGLLLYAALRRCKEPRGEGDVPANRQPSRPGSRASPPESPCVLGRQADYYMKMEKGGWAMRFAAGVRPHVDREWTQSGGACEWRHAHW